MPPAGELTGAPASLTGDADVLYVCTYDSGDVAPSQNINVGASHMGVIAHPFAEFPVPNVLRYTYEALSGNSASGCDVRASFTDLGIGGGPYEHLFSHGFLAFYDDFVFASTPSNTASSGGISNPKDGGGGANSHSVKLPGGLAGMNVATSRSYPGGGAADPPCQSQTADGWSVRNFLAELSGSETQVRPALYSYMGQNLSGNTCHSGGAGTDVKTTSFLFQRGLRLYFFAIEIILNSSTSSADGEQHLYLLDVDASGFGSLPTKVLSRTGLRYRTSSCPNAFINGYWPCSFPGGKYTFPGRHILGLPFIATALKAAPEPGTGSGGSSGTFIGSNATPGSTGSLSAHRERGSLFTAPISGTLTLARAYLPGNPGGAGVQDVRITARENLVTTAPEGGGSVNSPGDFVDYSADYEIAQADAAGYKDVGAMQVGYEVTEGERLWLNVHSGVGNAGLYGWDQSAGEFALLADTLDFPSGPSSTPGAVSTRNANRLAVNITITPPGGTAGFVTGGPNRHDELSSAGGTSTWSHAVADETNRLLLGFACYRRTLASMASMAFNTSEALSLLLAANQSTVCRAEMWKLVAPSVATANIVATNQGDTEDVVTASLSMGGIAQTDEVRDSDSSGGLTPSVTLTTQEGDIIVGVVASQNEITMSGVGWGGVHQIESFSGTGDAGLLVFTGEAGADTTEVSVTGDGANSMILVAAAFKRASAGADTTPPANVDTPTVSEPTTGTVRVAGNASVSLDQSSVKVRYKAGTDQTFSSHTDGTQFAAEAAKTTSEAYSFDLAGFDPSTAITVAVFCKDATGNWNTGTTANFTTAAEAPSDLSDYLTAAAADLATVLTEAQAAMTAARASGVRSELDEAANDLGQVQVAIRETARAAELYGRMSA